MTYVGFQTGEGCLLSLGFHDQSFAPHYICLFVCLFVWLFASVVVVVVAAAAVVVCGGGVFCSVAAVVVELVFRCCCCCWRGRGAIHILGLV